MRTHAQNYQITQFRADNKGNANLGTYSLETPEMPYKYDEMRLNKNFLIVQGIQNKRDAIPAVPAVGDIIHVDGKKIYITRADKDSDVCQTTSGAGGFSSINSGSFSYSGGLDKGVKYSDLVPTEKYDECRIWFPESSHLRAGSRVEGRVWVRVWELRKKTDKSGIWSLDNAEKIETLEAE